MSPASPARKSRAAFPAGWGVPTPRRRAGADPHRAGSRTQSGDQKTAAALTVLAELLGGSSQTSVLAP